MSILKQIVRETQYQYLTFQKENKTKRNKTKRHKTSFENLEIAHKACSTLAWGEVST